MLEVRKIPDSKTILIPVAKEDLNGCSTSDINEIKCGEKVYKVFDYFVIEKDESPQQALIKLATGKHLSKNELWKMYPNSDMVFFFVCDEVIQENKPVQKNNDHPEAV